VGTFANGLLRRSREGVWSYVVQNGPLFQNIINCIFEDREGSIWIGTENGGLHRLNSQKVKTILLPQAGQNTHVESVSAAHDGGFWIATGGAGVFRFRDGRFTRFAEAEGLTAAYLHMVLEDSHTNVWAATRGGLFRMEKGRFKKVEQLGPVTGWVMCLFEDREGRLWVGSGSGVACLDGEKTTWFKNELANQDIRSIAEDNSGNMWVGCVGAGLFRIANGRITHYGSAEGLESQTVVALLADADGTLWIGTFQDGLIRLKNGRFTTLTTRDGLIDNVSGHLADDGTGHLWVSTVHGVMRLNKAAMENYQSGKGRPLPIMALTRSDGFFNTHCSGGSDPAMSWAAGGVLLVPNMKAVAVVDTRGFPTAEPARTKIEEVLVNGQPQTPDGSGGLRVSSGQSRVEIHYTALNLSAAEQIRFRVKLDGWDKDWNEAGFHRSVAYGALPPGEYRFHVMGSRRDGLWDEAPAPLVLQVVPRFWETWWFRSAAGGGIVAGVGGVMLMVGRRRARRKLERLKRIHALEQERARIAQDLHDDFGSALSGLMLQGEAATQTEPSASRGAPVIASMTEGIRALIQKLDEVVWATNPRNDSLARVIAYLSDLAEGFVVPTGIHFRLDVPALAELPATILTSQQRHNLVLASKASLNNALRHARARTIGLRLRVQDQALVAEIWDDGKGFDPGKTRSGGNGLINITNRMAAIQGSATIRSQHGQGTTVTLVLPLANITL
jgi:signal transduction histidine kinase